MPIAIRCPHCSSRYTVVETTLGKPVKCANCQNRFQAAIDGHSAVPQPPATPPARKPPIRMPPARPGAAALPPASAPALGDSSSGSYNLFDDVLSSAAAAPSIPRPQPRPSSDAPSAKKRKAARDDSDDDDRIRTYQDSDGAWFASVSRQQILASPATWMMAGATGIGVLVLLLHLTGVQLDKGFVLVTLGAGGLAWLAGFVIIQNQYYKKWSDFGERNLTTAEAPMPSWMKVMAYGSVGAVMLPFIFIVQAAEDAELKKNAYQAYQGMSDDKAAVLAAIEEYHLECWSAAREGGGRRSRTNKNTYLEAMRTRLQARFARRGAVKSTVEEDARFRQRWAFDSISSGSVEVEEPRRAAFLGMAPLLRGPA